MSGGALEPQRADASPLVAEWMARYGPELKRHVGRMLGDADDAEDILQQLWITAIRRPPEVGPGSNARAWLFRVATNAALDRLARDGRRRAALNGRGPRIVQDEDAPPDARLLRLDRRARRRIREHVTRLPRKQREALWLRWVDGDDYATIARKLACSEESARANVYHGLKRLRKELFDLWKKEYEP
ncbi:MAG: sigma-70 family RNA polymerase sigma factor [Gemmatimonadetes bacterium]|nr:sigma-70 family RNA polymerase sigma factor [Gemmatimonadota bacterium]